MQIKAGHRKALISIVMGSVLLLQAVASFGTLAGLEANRKFWPWTNYPMYKHKYVAGDPMDVTGIIYLVLDSGEKIPFTEETLSIGFWKFSYLYDRLSTLEEPREADIELVLEAATTEAEIVAIETYHYPLEIRKNGASKTAEKFRRRIELEN